MLVRLLRPVVKSIHNIHHKAPDFLLIAFLKCICILTNNAIMYIDQQCYHCKGHSAIEVMVPLVLLLSWLEIDPDVLQGTLQVLANGFKNPQGSNFISAWRLRHWTYYCLTGLTNSGSAAVGCKILIPYNFWRTVTKGSSLKASNEFSYQVLGSICAHFTNRYIKLLLTLL